MVFTAYMTQHSIKWLLGAFDQEIFCNTIVIHIFNIESSCEVQDKEMKSDKHEQQLRH